MTGLGYGGNAKWKTKRCSESLQGEDNIIIDVGELMCKMWTDSTDSGQEPIAGFSEQDGHPGTIKGGNFPTSCESTF